jgi:putative sigma-54 modulation protein
MEVEFTARQVRISKVARSKAEEGLQRLSRIVGKTATASAIFTAQKLDQIVELTVQGRSQKLVAKGKAATQSAALKEALERIEAQALRHRDRHLETKRLPKEDKLVEEPPVTRGKGHASRKSTANAETVERGKARQRKTIAGRARPAHPAISEPHILAAAEAVAEHAMTIEEAVKELEAGDRDLLIFRNAAGEQYVLHRRRDGEVELVEIP